MSKFVLVHGAWLGGWSWEPVARRLRARGHQALTPTLPGTSWDAESRDVGLLDAVEALVQEFEQRDLLDVHLVAHSWGGYPATGVAGRVAHRISEVVYLAAAVPARDRSLSEENPDSTAMIRGAIASSGDGTLPIDLESFSGAMLPGASPDLQRMVWELTTPFPGRYMTEALAVDPVTTLGMQVRYAIGEDDRALTRPASDYAARLGIAPTLLPGGHLALLTDPDLITDFLLASAPHDA